VLRTGGLQRLGTQDFVRWRFGLLKRSREGQSWQQLTQDALWQDWPGSLRLGHSEPVLCNTDPRPQGASVVQSQVWHRPGRCAVRSTGAKHGPFATPSISTCRGPAGRGRAQASWLVPRRLAEDHVASLWLRDSISVLHWRLRIRRPHSLALVGNSKQAVKGGVGLRLAHMALLSRASSQEQSRTNRAHNGHGRPRACGPCRLRSASAGQGGRRMRANSSG